MNQCFNDSMGQSLGDGLSWCLGALVSWWFIVPRSTCREASGGVICFGDEMPRGSSLPHVTELVTIVSNMSTARASSGLSAALMTPRGCRISGSRYSYLSATMGSTLVARRG